MTTVVHVLLTGLAVAGLWRLWRLIGSSDRTVAAIVGIGLLVRIVGGELLFWMSWFHWPIGRSLQLGDGLWFFAIDGQGTVAYASQVLSEGPWAVMTLDATARSHGFVQLFAVAWAAFGSVSSAIVLLNGFAFLFTCLAIVRLAPPAGAWRSGCLVALGFLAFGPAAILWSWGPLKDTAVTALIAGIVLMGQRWEFAARQPGGADYRQLLWSGLAIAALVYITSGMRWYVGAMIWVLFGLFFVVTALTTRSRTRPVLAGLVVFVLVAQAVRFGGDGDVPAWAKSVLNPATSISSASPVDQMVKSLGKARQGFDRAAGASAIRSPVSAPTPAARQPSVAVPDLGEGAMAGAPSVTAQPPPDSGRFRRIAGRLSAGFTALVVPPDLIRRFGLLHIESTPGHNFWAFVDLDTIVLDVLLVVGIVSSARRLAKGPPTALFLLAALAGMALAAPMVYAVTNFGTLFRLRQMIFTVGLLLPLTLRGPRTNGRSDPASGAERR